MGRYIYISTTSVESHRRTRIRHSTKVGMMKYVPIILYGICLQVNSSIDLYKAHNTYTYTYRIAWEHKLREFLETYIRFSN